MINTVVLNDPHRVIKPNQLRVIKVRNKFHSFGKHNRYK